MTNPIPALRASAFSRQSGICYYCKMPMWQGCSRAFEERYFLTRAQAKRFMCTAEHLLARQDGGEHSSENIVAACMFCNQSRHKRMTPLEPKLYERMVSSRLQKQRWHGAEIIRKLQAGTA